MCLIPRNHLELFIYSFMVLNIFKLQYYCQICEIFTFWFLFAVNYNYQHMGVDAFIKDDIYLKVIELEISYWCQTICFWYQGIIWNCVYGVTLLENRIWLPNMWNIYFVFPSAVKYVSKWMILMINWQKYICIRLIRKNTNTVWHLFIIMRTSNYINYIYSYTNYI